MDSKLYKSVRLISDWLDSIKEKKAFHGHVAAVVLAAEESYEHHRLIQELETQNEFLKTLIQTVFGERSEVARRRQLDALWAAINDLRGDIHELRGDEDA